jgi:hypothetical protein
MRSPLCPEALFATSLLACTTIACSGTDQPSGAETSAATSGSGGATESGATSGSGGHFSPGGELTTYEAALGPVTVAPGAEETRCVLVRLDNPEPVLVRRFRTDLSEGAHHFIVYRSEATEPDAAPEACPGFSGFTTGEVTIFIAQHAEAELTFPDEAGTPVGLELAAQQMLRLEMHWLNPGGEPLEVSAKVIVDTIPMSDDAIRSDVAFWGTTKLNGGGDPPSDTIPPNSPGDTGVLFQPALAQTKSFALTTHQHWRGKRMRIWYADGPTADGPLLADVTNWAEPPLLHLDPAVEFPAGAAEGESSSRGLSYRCEYENTTADEVGFGESAATDEMCFLWHYYYPSHGLHYCVDGNCD